MLVSVVMTVFNGERYIDEAIRSALAEGSCVAEVNVYDDASTDRTADVVKAIGDPRVRLLGGKKLGMPGGRNAAAAAATSEWLYFLDADDRVQPNALNHLITAAQSTPDADVIYGDYDRIAADGRPIGRRALLRYRPKPSGDVLRALLTGNIMVVGAQIVRRSAYEKAGGFNETLKVSDDWEFWCRLATFGTFQFVPGLKVLDYRMHSNSTMHARPRPFEDWLPAINAVYSHADIRRRIPADELNRYRRKSEAAKLSYISTEAIRMSAYSDAVSALARSIVRDPAGAPKAIVKAAGTFAGL